MRKQKPKKKWLNYSNGTNVFWNSIRNWKRRWRGTFGHGSDVARCSQPWYINTITSHHTISPIHWKFSIVRTADERTDVGTAINLHQFIMNFHQNRTHSRWHTVKGSRELTTAQTDTARSCTENRKQLKIEINFIIFKLKFIISSNDLLVRVKLWSDLCVCAWFVAVWTMDMDASNFNILFPFRGRFFLLWTH